MNELLAVLHLSPLQFWATGVAVLAAALIRGYAGFGFSAIVVASLSLLLPTREVVPLVIVLEIVASVQMFPKVWKQINWRLVGWIILGSLPLVPWGQAALVWVSQDVIRVVCAVLLLLAVGLTARGVQFGLPSAPKGWLFIGAISGFVNGLCAMGGMWMMVLLLSSTITVATLRASLVAYFFVGDLYASASAVLQGLLDWMIIWRCLAALPFLMLGIYLGSKKFASTSEETYRKVVFTILAVLAVLLAVRGLVGLV